MSYPISIPSQPTPYIRPKRPTRSLPPPPPTDCSSDHHENGNVLHDISPATELTPIRAHYLKKSLIQLQFRHEINAITTNYPSNISTLSFLGQPFTPPPRDANPYLDLPLLRFIFHQFILTFPFMAAAPRDFYSDKLQPFVTSAMSRNISPTSVLDGEDDDDGDGDDGDNNTNSDRTTHKKLLAKIERNLSMFLSSATKLVEREEVVRLNQVDLDRLEVLAKKKIAKGNKAKVVFEVNVIGVRTVLDRGRVRSRLHEEFIVRTRRSGLSDVFVSRRYGDFRTLTAELQKAHPDEQIRPPPPKDRTAVTISPNNDHPSTQHYSSPSQSPGSTNSRLAREKNRLTLRSYLYSLLTSSTIASSPVLRSFLLSGSITLTRDELEDVRRREEADRAREDGQKKFAKEIASRVEGLREAVKSVKGDILGKDGLTHIIATVKATPDVRDLPPNYQAVLEWARISLASTVYHHYIASDNSSETFASLKRIHGLMPYFMLKTVLKISNPVAMIRGVLDLFLAQPFGGKSLLQRMFTSSLTEEVKALESQIESVKDKVDDPIMCAKIRQFVYAPKEIQDAYKVDAAAERIHLLIVVLRAPDEPVLSRMQMHRLAKAKRAHAEYLKHRSELSDSEDDDGPQNDDAWLLEDLKVLTHLFSKLRDREQLIALVFEGSTADMLKDIITIFYAPLAQVYRAASIADSLGDMQSFINDLIRTVEQVEEISQEDPHHTVQAFIDLIQRHEQSFYHFVHKVHSKGEKLFDGLMHWIELFLTVIREGLGSLVSLEFLLPHMGRERDDVMSEVDKVALHHYKLKVAYEAKIRRRFRRMQEIRGGADVEDDATQALVNGIVGEIDLGELVHGDAAELAAEDTDDESEYESTDGSDSDDTEDDSDEESSIEENRSPQGAVTDSPTTGSSHHAGVGPNSGLPLHERAPSLRSSHSFQSSRHSQDLPATSPSAFTPRRAGSELWPKQPPLPPSPGPKSHSMDENSPTSSHNPSSMRSPSRRGSETLTSPGRSSPSKSDLGDPSRLGLHDSKSKLSQSSSSRRSNEISVPKPKKKKAAVHAPKAPPLEHIPKLLPVFIEMIRPLLQPRQVDNNN